MLKQIKVKIGEGEKIMAFLEGELAAKGIKEAVIVSCVGALRDFELITIHQESKKIPPEHYKKKFDLKAELMGNGSVAAGSAHLHVVCGLDGGSALAGHLVEGTVTYFAEVTLLAEV
ncbi:DNA-binding protein [bacterium]|nr:DNA-binding protein [bacterium]MBU3955380.1 DNA-binding protein [bacterium]MBU4133860.1 DNA-binding protein [bacterium]